MPEQPPARTDALPSTPLRHAWFKAALFALLAANTVAYTVSGTVTEAMDALAWLTLLTLFELETDFGPGSSGGWIRKLVRGARAIAAAFVAAAAWRYLREREWLDAMNVALWIAVVLLLEAQVRFPGVAAARRPAWRAAIVLLYAGLAALAVAWMSRGEWFDAYDALLWLAALVVIEMNILRRAAAAAPGRHFWTLRSR